MAMQPLSSALYNTASRSGNSMASTNVLETEDTSTSTMLESSGTCVYSMQTHVYSAPRACGKITVMSTGVNTTVVYSSANARLQTELVHVASAKK